MLKCQFHAHCQGDPADSIDYTAKELVDKAVKLKYDVLSITCHRKLIFNKGLEKYARKKGLLLIPGIEFEINKKHVLGINIDRDIEQVDSFEKLKNYKKTHPQCLIIAPHPFFPSKTSLKGELIENIELFDAIEISFAYTKSKNYNTPALSMAKRWKKPIIATADCHILSYLDIGYCNIKATKNTKSIVEAIKKGHIQNFSKPTTYSKIIRMLCQINFQNFQKKLSQCQPH